MLSGSVLATVLIEEINCGSLKQNKCQQLADTFNGSPVTITWGLPSGSSSSVVSYNHTAMLIDYAAKVTSRQHAQGIHMISLLTCV